MSNYWADRLTKEQNAISKQTEKNIEKKLRKYYKDSMESVISDFEATYDKLQASIESGRDPTPADLYKLDRYWQMQGQLKKELQELGDKEIEMMSKEFEREWKAVYDSIALPSELGFSTVATGDVRAVVNTSWLPDGKNFSQRLWGNNEKLAETLNDNLLHCVQTGKDTRELKELLQNRFKVSYNSANTLVRTETAHIQTQAASQRYQDYGLKYYEFLADPDERTCDRCGALDRKKFLYSEMVPGKNAPPMHPNDRCTIIPVIDNNGSEEKVMKKEFDYRSKEITGYIVKCKDCGHEWENEYLQNYDICPSCGKMNWGLKETKTVYKDKNDTKIALTYEEERQQEKIIRDEAKAKADAKTQKGKTESDAYTTNPLKKKIREAKKKEGEFKYYTHHCPHCDRYFDSTVADKKKCPLCGEELSGTRWKATEHLINNKKCMHCGKMFDTGKDLNKVICDECRQELLSSKEAEKMRKHGYTDKGIVSKYTGWSSGYGAEYRFLDSEYIKKHPEQAEMIQKMHFNPENYDAHFEEHHFIACIDCGEIVFIENMNNAQKRCPECQAKYRKQYKAQKEKERRAKNKKK